MNRRHFLLAAMAAALPAPAVHAARGRGHAARLGLLLPAGDGASQAVHAGVLAALDRIARSPSLSGRPLILRHEETDGSARAFLRAAQAMASGEDRVHSLMGVMPEEGRAEIVDWLERSDGLFWDCLPTMGGGCSRALIHAGPTPYQSLKHLIPFLKAEVGGRFLLVGTDAGHPREILRVGARMVAALGGTCLDPLEIRPPGHADFADVVLRIRRERVDVVLCTLVGASLAAFLRAYRAARLDPRQIPVASPTLSELDVAAIGREALSGQIAAQPYFATWRSTENRRFLEHLRRRGGIACAAAEAAWTQVHLFAAALSRLDGADLHPLTVREAARGCEVPAPQGPVRLDDKDLHAGLWPKIAVGTAAGRFKVLTQARTALPGLPNWAHPGRSCPDTPPTAARPVLLRGEI